MSSQPLKNVWKIISQKMVENLQILKHEKLCIDVKYDNSRWMMSRWQCY